MSWFNYDSTSELWTNNFFGLMTDSVLKTLVETSPYAFEFGIPLFKMCDRRDSNGPKVESPSMAYWGGFGLLPGPFVEGRYIYIKGPTQNWKIYSPTQRFYHQSDWFKTSWNPTLTQKVEPNRTKLWLMVESVKLVVRSNF